MGLAAVIVGKGPDDWLYLRVVLAIALYAEVRIFSRKAICRHSTVVLFNLLRIGTLKSGQLVQNSEFLPILDGKQLYLIKFGLRFNPHLIQSIDYIRELGLKSVELTSVLLREVFYITENEVLTGLHCFPAGLEGCLDEVVMDGVALVDLVVEVAHGCEDQWNEEVHEHQLRIFLLLRDRLWFSTWKWLLFRLCLWLVRH